MGRRIALSISRVSPTRAASASSASRVSSLARLAASRGRRARGTPARRRARASPRGPRRAAPRPSARLRPRACAAACSASGSASARARSLGRQARVAARHRQAVGLAHGRARLDAHRQVQVGDEPADHDHLLGVLLAEVGDVGQRHAEQLRHDRADAAEVLGAARGALEPLGRRRAPRPPSRSPAGRPPRPTARTACLRRRREASSRVAALVARG